MSWTDERINLLKKMWKDGKSAAEIAKTLGKGVTRNAVIGKAHRMGLSGRPSPIKKPTAAPAKKEKEAAAPRKEVAAPKESAVPRKAQQQQTKHPPLMHNREVEEPRKPEKEILPLNGGTPLIDLTERMCKWPIGDPREADFTFCGRGIRVGTPYCPDHAAMAYQTSSRGRPAAKVAATAVAAAAVKDEEIEEVVVEDGEEEDEEVTA
jgi:GcrA cell cycle regulator